MVFVAKASGGEILGWELDHPNEPCFHINNTDAPSYLSVSPNGSILLALGNDIRLWDIKTGNFLIKLDINNRRIARAAFTKNGRSIRTAYDIIPDIWSWEIPDKQGAIDSLRRRYSSEW